MNRTTCGAWPQLQSKAIHSLFCLSLIHLYRWLFLKHNTAIIFHCIKVLASPTDTAKQLPYKIVSPGITKDC